MLIFRPKIIDGVGVVVKLPIFFLKIVISYFGRVTGHGKSEHLRKVSYLYN
jgi:hypothetical protein